MAWQTINRKHGWGSDKMPPAWYSRPCVSFNSSYLEFNDETVNQYGLVAGQPVRLMVDTMSNKIALVPAGADEPGTYQLKPTPPSEKKINPNNNRLRVYCVGTMKKFFPSAINRKFFVKRNGDGMLEITLETAHEAKPVK